jgi:uncharacterized membrane protein
MICRPGAIFHSFSGCGVSSSIVATLDEKENLRPQEGSIAMEETPQGPNDSAPPPAAPAPPEKPAETSSPDIVSDNRSVMIVLAYLWLLALIPLLVEKDDREVQWHAKHGLVLTVVEVVVMIALQVVVMILGAISGGLGCIFGLLFPLFMLAILVVHVMCIVKGINGGRFTLPGISEFADRF